MTWLSSKSPKDEAEANLIGSALDADKKISETIRALDQEITALKIYLSFFDKGSTPQLETAKKIQQLVKDARELHQKGILSRRPR